MSARSLLVGALLAMFVVSCAPAVDPPVATEAAPSTEMAAPPAPETQTITVNIDGSGGDFAASSLAYFPRDVTVHAGDTVEFYPIDTGEPHSVTFGSLADDAATAWEEMSWAAAEGPEFAKLPLMIPEDGSEVVQSAAQPCFLETGEPGKDACDVQELPDFDGSATFYNSGWIAPDEEFNVTFADDIAPGTYRYLCLLHLPFMTGSVTVVASDEEVPTPEDVDAMAATELDATVAMIASVVEAAAPEAGNVLAGLLSEEAPEAIANVFIPAELEIAAGDSVTWSVMGPHTISFNAPPGSTALRMEAPDGSIQLNPLTVAPANSAGMPPPPEAEPAAPDAAPEATPDPNAAPEPPGPPIEIDGGSWDGEGNLSSGLLLSFPPAPLFNYKLAFDAPGSYAYMCLLHPLMTGTIVVK